MGQAVVDVNDLSRSFGGKTALDGVSFHATAGQVHGLLHGVAARHADEYNVDGLAPDDFAAFSQRLDVACRAAGRLAESMRRSVTLSVLIAGTPQHLKAKASELGTVFPDYAEMRPDDVLGELGKSPGSWVVGTPDQIAARLSEYAPVGASRVILTVWLLDDLEDTLTLLAREVAPALLRPSEGAS